MTTRPPHPRPGLGLTEVLVALFVMALGLIGILTLFPIGAMSIAHGLKDDRCTETALQADGFLRAYWKANVVADPTSTTATNLTNAMTTNTAATPTSITGGPSRAVLIDPIGLTLSGAWSTVANVPNGIPRRSLTLPGSAIETCILQDDLAFDPNGAPNPSAVVRTGRYSWAAVAQMRDVTNPVLADLTILVFDSRPPGIWTADNEKVPSNTVTLTAGQRSVTVQGLTQSDPTAVALARKGGWFMDGTDDGTTGATGVRGADFFRITGVTPGTNAGEYTLDFEPPYTGTTSTRTLYFLSGLVEVFRRPALGTTPIQ